MLSNIRNTVITFLKSDKDFPVLAAIAAGLYPLIYNYNRNFTLVNSWYQLFFYTLTYLLIPIIIFYISSTFVKRISFLKDYSKYVIPVLNICFFALFVVISTYGLKKKILAVVLFLAFFLSILLAKHIKKIIVFQLLLTSFVCINILPYFYRSLTYSEEWMTQEDAICDVEFKKRYNVYYIQPDGYANFSEIKKSPYNFDNSKFESYLVDNNFKLYPEYRSNYFSTLTSNSSMFSMKHHYFNSPKIGMNELHNSRAIIAGNNPVINIFKKNNYKTHIVSDNSYLIVNRPEIGYDYSNVSYNEISFLARGFEIKKDVIKDVEKAILSNVKDTNSFYFIEKIAPGHIANNYNSDPNTIENERDKYLLRLQQANAWLTEIITKIQELDHNALIIIGADHGGFVGLNNIGECRKEIKDASLVRSIFTAALAIKWPDKAPHFDDKLKSNVNLFRILFAYLGEEEQYLSHLQDDKSFTVIKKGAPYGVYELINEKDEVVFEKLEK